MADSIFEFSDYKAYLKAKTGPKTQRRGLKSQMAAAIRVQPTYISQVLNGQAHLSLEQADLLNSFLGHSPDESHYFLLLVQLARAGTPSLESYFREQIEEVLSKRMILIERLGQKNELSEEQQSRYYSSWHYAAFHIALTIPGLGNPKALSDFFNVPLAKTNQVLEFLTSTGLAEVNKAGEYVAGSQLIRLGNNSPNIYRHHSNWRQQAIESLDREDLEDLHYSGVVSLSREDARKIKDRLLERLKEDLEAIKESTSEQLYSYCIDFFGLKR